MSEEWRGVVGYEDLYEVSSHGRVRSNARVDRLGRIRTGKILTPTGVRHLHVTLSRDGKKRQQAVHRLVAEAFLPNPSCQPMVLHWDDKATNNHVSNLRWGTSGENRSDAVRNGIRVGGSLTEQQVHEVRQRIAGGEAQQHIAHSLGVDQSNISLIATGRIWRNV